jgi:hypothetical protein
MLPGIWFIAFMFLLAAVPLPASGRDTVTITESGRRIQLDGFLLDWVKKGRHVWSGSGGWVWDALSTPEGLAGYFHCGMAPCSTWTFYLDLNSQKGRPWIIAMADSAQGADGRYRTTRTSRDGGCVTTFEWLIPWDSLTIDSTGAWEVHFAGESGCTDTLDPFLIRGTMRPTASALPSRFVERVVLIVVLLAAFIALQLAMRKKSRRRGSLRRSA